VVITVTDRRKNRVRKVSGADRKIRSIMQEVVVVILVGSLTIWVRQKLVLSWSVGVVEGLALKSPQKIRLERFRGCS